MAIFVLWYQSVNLIKSFSAGFLIPFQQGKVVLPHSAAIVSHVEFPVAAGCGELHYSPVEELTPSKPQLLGVEVQAPHSLH
jgi:hypothetical protein